MVREKLDAVKVSAVFTIVGGSLLFSGWKRFRNLQEIEDTASSDIRSAAQGLAALQGHALPLNKTFPTINGQTAVYRELIIEEKQGKNWVTLSKEKWGESFVVSDGTGLVLVETLEADLLLKENRFFLNKIDPEAREALVTRYGLANATEGFFLVNRQFRISEQFILLGAPVYLRGAFFTQRGLPPYNLDPINIHFLRKIADLRKEKGGKLKAFDLNRDGQMSEEEIAKGSEKLMYFAIRSVQADDTFEGVAFTGAMKKDLNHGLMIADTFRDTLRTRVSSRIPERIVGGILMISIGIGVLVMAATS